MTIDISALSNASFDELHFSLLLSGPNAPTVNGTTYTVSPINATSLAAYDNWNGVIGNPDPNDPAALNTFFPAITTPGILEYTTTTASGATSPSVGGIGAEIIAANSTGYLFEQLTGYVPGAIPVIVPDGTFFILSTTDLSVYDGSVDPSAVLTFSSTFTPAIPEPSTALLMPVVFAALMVSRIRGVRSFLRAR